MAALLPAGMLLLALVSFGLSVFAFVQSAKAFQAHAGFWPWHDGFVGRAFGGEFHDLYDFDKASNRFVRKRG